MPLGPHHQVENLQRIPGELSFEVKLGEGPPQPVWFRTATPVTPSADAALATALMPAMTTGGRLELTDPVSTRVLRTQAEFQAIQRAWSLEPTFAAAPLHEVEVLAPTRRSDPPGSEGRVAAFLSGGVDSWATVLSNPDVTDLIFVKGMDLRSGSADHTTLVGQVEERLREGASTLGLPLHVVDTNLRELSDPVIPWDYYYGCAAVAVAHFLSPLFERVLIAGNSDYEVQEKFGANWMVDQLWSSEQLEIVDSGGRLSRSERLRLIAGNPVVQQTLRVCWQNPGSAYNCGRCRKCLMTMVGLEALGVRRRFATFPDDLDLEAVAATELGQPVHLTLWEDVLDSIRSAGRSDLEAAVATTVARGKRLLGLPPTYRRRNTPGPPPTIRVGVVVPAWNQARYLAAAVQSALDQEVDTGVGVVIVNDGCPDPETHRVGSAMRDANPERVAYLRQGNRGLSGARNAGIRLALTRWPQIETIFPLDADNLLSPATLAALLRKLDEHPEAAWATPALEFFGNEEGEWLMPGPYLPFRQLLNNQCDAGSLIRRQVFTAGIDYDETMRDGFEDWEFFLHATLAGFGGAQAGRCGFRYRRHDSMLASAQRQASRLEAEIRKRHPDAYEPKALLEREHAEAPRFALLCCDRKEALLTAGGTLEPHRLGLVEYARFIAAGPEGVPPFAAHIPAITVLTSAATIERLNANSQLDAALGQLQRALRTGSVAGLRDRSSGQLAGVALRPGALAKLTDEAQPILEAMVEVEGLAISATPLSLGEATRAAALIGAAVIERGVPLPPTLTPASSSTGI